jgi:hypothetical protein
MILRPLLLLSLVATVAMADDDFPGLKQVMTPREWQHAGLDQLSADQVAIIDSALTRHYAHTVEQAAKDATSRAIAQEKARQAQLSKDGKQTWFEQTFGSPDRNLDWRQQPALKATVVGWASDNRFILSNKQVWEGVDYIPYELKGHTIEIQPRPFGEYALILDGKTTTIRVRRIQ